MTENKIFLNSRTKSAADYAFFVFILMIFILIFSAFIKLSDEITVSIMQGLLMCYTTIIPSVFPFLIISDLMLTYLNFDIITPLKRGFERFFKINGYALSVFLCGAVTGFPIGVRLARKLYDSDIITKDECERLIGFSNHPSPAFVICAIGIRMRKSLFDGIILYTVAILSSLITAFVFSRKKAASQKKKESTEKLSFSLAYSIKNATEATVNICGFISFFSLIIGICKHLIKSKKILMFLSVFLEIGNSTALIAADTSLSYPLSLALTAFAVSFSGLSVHMQAKSMLGGSDIKLTRYYLMKLSSGIISFMIAFIIATSI